MLHWKRLVLFSTVVALFWGCAPDPWQQYYANIPAPRPSDVETCKNVKMVKVDDLDANIFFRLFTEGYVPTGYVEFNGTENYLDESAIRAQALAHNACICYYGSNFSHTEKGVQVVSSFMAPETSAVPGTSPVATSVALGDTERKMYNYIAVFAGKDRNPLVLGIIAVVPPENYREKSSTEGGLLVLAVRKGSLMDKASVQRGDILVTLDDKPVTSELLENWRFKLADSLRSNGKIDPAKKHSVTVYRDGQTIRHTF